MNLGAVLKKAWNMLWNYRSLWLFGTILALVGVKTILPGPWLDWENNRQWTKIILSDSTTLQLPGGDMTVDLTAPGGFQITVPDSVSWSEFNDLVNILDREASIKLRPILIEFAIILVVLLLVGLIVRYITETALMRMVDETEETGKNLSIWNGLRRGASIRAWRLFLLDLVVGILVIVAFIVAFGLAITPVLLAIGSQEAVIILGAAGTFGMLLLVFFLSLAVTVVLSGVMQVIRRACVLEDQSLLSSIRQGISLTRQHIKDIALLWMTWVGLLILWVPLVLPVIILLVPFLLVTMLVGIALGGISTALVAGIADLFISGGTPWIMGGLAGLPVFIVVMISPILFVNGFMEVYLSSMWTLAYRNLKHGSLPA